jgi:hypothetical protein
LLKQMRQGVASGGQPYALRFENVLGGFLEERQVIRCARPARLTPSVLQQLFVCVEFCMGHPETLVIVAGEHVGTVTLHKPADLGINQQRAPGRAVCGMVVAGASRCVTGRHHLFIVARSGQRPRIVDGFVKGRLCCLE